MTRKKSAILQAAARLFSERGFKETSIADLAGATGVAEGTIFYHFKNKEDILITILKGLKEDILAEFVAFAGQSHPESGLHSMERAISFYLYLASKMDDRFLLLHRHYPYRLAEVNPLCREYLEDIFNCLLDIFEQAMGKGQSDGNIAPMHPRKNAMIAFILADGLVRFRDFNLYDAATLHREVMSAVGRMFSHPAYPER